jgi:hypothetical protein
MPKFVGVCNVAAVPRHKEIAAMKRGHRQVKCVTAWIMWHHVVGNVRLN